MNSRNSRIRPGLPAALALLAGLLLTGLLHAVVHGYEETNQRAAFERSALERVGVLRAELDSVADVLGTVTRVFTTMQPVTRRQFEAFTGPMLKRNPQIELIGWQRVVTDAERAAFEAARRQEFPAYGFSEIAGAGQGPAGRRPLYQVVDYLMPQQGNEQVLGLDAASRPELAEAARRACASGEAAMTRQFRLLLGGSRQSGFMLLMPVYREGTALLPGARQCAQVLGYTTVAFTSLALKRRVLEAVGAQGRAAGAVRLYAAGRADPDELVFVQEGEAPSAPASLLDGEQAPPVARTLNVAGQPWHMVISPPPPDLLRDHLGSLLVLAGGVLASLGAAAWANMLSQRAGAVQVIVDQRTAELTAANASLRLRQQAIDACVNSIIIARAEEPAFPIEYVNPAFERLNGYRAEEVVGRSGSLLWARDANQRGVREGLAMARERRGGNVLVRTFRKDGTQLWCEMVVSPCTGADGKVEHFVIIQHDVTEQRRVEGELEYQATHDALTGLANRKLLRRRLEEEIAVAARAGQAVSLLFIDLDRFKPLNDSLGHAAANAYLCAVADRLRETVREGDTVARLSADEFVLVLPQRTGLPLGGPAVERIMQTIAQPVSVDGQELEVSCCIGIAQYPADGNDPDFLIDYADRATRSAKRCGAGNFQFFQAAMNDAAHRRLELERAFRGARERGEFDLLYQPWADLASGRVAGVQAKVRWRHPELGEVAPERFLPIADESGTSIALGAWVLREAAARVRGWQQAGTGDHGELVLALGVGLRQVKDPGLLSMVEEALADTGLPARCLRLELAECVLAGDATRILPVLDSLRALGVRLAVDRFGNGHTTLADLRRYPIDVIQIDRSLVQDVDISFAAEAIPDAIISMAHSLGIRVLAEGVDSANQAEVLARNMCDEVSGTLLSAPLEPEAAGALLAAGTGLPRNVLRLHKRERTLLLVDDEPNILTALKRQMRGAGCRILTAPGGQEGLALLEREQVDVIVSDQRMPGMTGVEFLRAVKESHPETVRIVLSGFTELQSVTDAVNEGAIYKFLTKPWDDTQLRGHIEEAFRHKEMVDENRRLGLELRTANLELAGANRQLEDLLQQQREQIRRDGISLDIVREALQRVPLAILALDEEQQIAYANASARQMLGDGDTLLGSDAAEVIPDLLAGLEGRAGEVPLAFRRGDRSYAVQVQSMGRGTRSRGTLITFVPAPAAATARTAPVGAGGAA